MMRQLETHLETNATRSHIDRTILLGLLIYGATLCHAGERVNADGNKEARVPPAVRQFLAEEFENAERERNALVDSGSQDFLREFTLLYYARAGRTAAGDADNKSRWVIGYRIARSGNGSVPVNRCVIVEEGAGNTLNAIVRLPEECAGDDGLVVEVDRGTWLLAVSRFDGRHAPNHVRLFALDPRPRLVFQYHRPLDGPSWYSSLYFIDADADGDLDIVASRVVRDFTARTKWREHLVYRAASAGGVVTFEKGEPISSEQFRRVVGKDPAAHKHIVQHGMPYEQAVDDQLREVEPPKGTARQNAKTRKAKVTPREIGTRRG
jgi:hypothetical protein